MTQPSEVTGAAPSMVTDPPRRRRRLVIAVLGVASLAVVAGGLVTWHRVAAARADQVEVAWTGPPECTGAQVSQDGRWASESSEPFIKAERGMRCVVTVEVRNRGGSDVHIEHARMPMVGPGAGTVIEVDTTSDPDLWDFPVDDDMTVLRVLGTNLAAGEVTRFEVPIVFRESGCSGGPRQGGFTSMRHFPALTVSSMWLSFDRSAGNVLAHTQVSPSRGCVRMSRG